MAQFIYKINQERVELQEMPAGLLRNQFEALQGVVSKALGSLQCSIHHREPIIFLGSDAGKAQFQGYGGCCNELGKEVKHHLLPLFPEIAGMTVTTKNVTVTAHE